MTRLFLMTTALAGLALTGGGWAAAQTAPAPTDHQGHHQTTPANPAPAKPAPAKPAPAKPAATPAAPAPAAAPPGRGKMGMGGMGMMGMMGTPGGETGMCSMMGGGNMGHMGGGMGAMFNMAGAGTQVAVKNVDKGVTITLTTSDPAKVVRLQKMAEAMRLMHEATAQ